MIAAPATPGKWLDSSTPITSAVAAALVAAGIVGVVRYVPLPANSGAHDISAAELALLVGAGLEVMLVQHVRYPPWMPGQHDGYADGAVARVAAQNVGYPVGCALWCDLEGATGQAPDVQRYLHDWAGGAEPFSASLYVGYDAILTPDELYALPDYHCYWSDAGHRQVSRRGVALQQGAEIVIDGTTFDADVLSADRLGGLPVSCRAG